jgi:hypothetical protein
VDGIAYDANDDSIYYTPDVSCHVYHFASDGTFLNLVTPKNAVGASDCQVSGVTVGSANTLYIGRDGAAEIRRIDKTTGAFISTFATTSGRVEDLTCDPITYAPLEAVLSKDAFNVLYEAFEVEEGTCPGPEGINKRLVSGPERIGIYLPDPTVYVFEISYSGPEALVVDTVPAEFGDVVCVSSDGSPVSVESANGKGNGKSATIIEWEAPAGSTTLTCTIQTRMSPGKGHGKKGEVVHKPTACGLLSLNDGAIAYEVDEQGNLVLDPDGNPIPLFDPTDPLTVDAVDGAKLCQPCDALNDKCIDADGTATAGRGDFGVDGEVMAGDSLSSWPTGGWNEGLDWFDNDDSCTWTLGDDLHVEDPDTHPGALRDGKHDDNIDNFDPLVLDLDGNLADGQGVDVDLETGTVNPNGFSDSLCDGPDPLLKFKDTSTNTYWDNGEDIVLDVNGDGIFN